tara:strand:+ start:98 stop:223 length:126 start_codon:yes stop_codon:yes gene_type:complete
MCKLISYLGSSRPIKGNLSSIIVLNGYPKKKMELYGTIESI